MKIIAVDPGNVSGVAYMEADLPCGKDPRCGGDNECLFHGDGPYAGKVLMWRAWEDRPFEIIGAVETWISSADTLMGTDDKLVVCESFIPRPGAHSWQPDALYTIGALKYLCERENVEFALQSPANAKKFSTDAKLKRIGWYIRTPDGHTNDALRHLLLAAVKIGVVAPEQLIERSVPEGSIL